MSVPKKNIVRAETITELILARAGNSAGADCTLQATTFSLGSINDPSIQFEQVKHTLSENYTVTIFDFWGSNLAMQAGICTCP